MIRPFLITLPDGCWYSYSRVSFERQEYVRPLLTRMFREVNARTYHRTTRLE